MHIFPTLLSKCAGKTGYAKTIMVCLCCLQFLLIPDYAITAEQRGANSLPAEKGAGKAWQADRDPAAIAPAGDVSFSAALSRLPGNTWVELPGTELKSILAPEAFKDQDIHAIIGPRGIVDAWNGAVWIEEEQRMDIVAAGGHGDYCGNEYNSFRLEERRWVKIHGPSKMDGYDFKTGKGLNGKPGIMLDGKPASRHTYQGNVYHPPGKKIYMFGGSLCSGAGAADSNWWSVTLDGDYELLGGTGRWEGLGDHALFDPVTGYLFRSKRNNILRFDIDQRELKRMSSRGDKSWGASAAIDSTRRTILTFGHGTAFSYQIDSGVVVDIAPTGDTELMEHPGIGLVYIKSIDRYVAWREGRTLFLIHPETWHIETLATKGSHPSENPNGVYGRFAFSEKHQVFIVMSAIDQNIKILKLNPVQAI